MMKRRAEEKEARLERISEEDRILKMEEKKKIIEDTERSLRYDTQRFNILYLCAL